MIEFLKKFYEQRFKRITVILLDDTKPGKDNSYSFKPSSFFLLFGTLIFLASTMVALVFMFTPLGSLLYSKEDVEMRKQVRSITESVIALQDSLTIRDSQLSEMRNIIRYSLDTTLNIDQRFNSLINLQQNETTSSIEWTSSVDTDDKLNTKGMIFSNVMKSAPDFPASYPVDGTLTRGYEPEQSHFGIDIATKSDALITSVADGTIINASWTISDGYVISIQHADGIMSLYKHCATLTKKSGDAVLKGDIIGSTGDVGISSSGPHLHIEIWKGGFSQNPAMFLIP
ncbi:MAG: M23 family metallopeptidase [Balneolaceae bacterium]